MLHSKLSIKLASFSMSNKGWPKVNQPINQCVHEDYCLANQYARAFWPSQEPKLTVTKGGMQSQLESSRDTLRQCYKNAAFLFGWVLVWGFFCFEGQGRSRSNFATWFSPGFEEFSGPLPACRSAPVLSTLRSLGLQSHCWWPYISSAAGSLGV